MSKNILIMYGTRWGSTEEIAQYIAEFLKKQTIAVDVVDFKSAVNHSLNDYDAILIGSGIRIDRWTKESTNYVKNNIPELVKHPNLAFFVTCGSAADPDTVHEAEENYILNYLAKLGFNKESYIYEAFGGKIDLTKESKMKWYDKILIQVYSIFNNDIAIQNNNKNDYRDWKKVESFANRIINKLQKLYS